MRRSDFGEHERHIVDDDDTLNNYSELKELLRQSFNTFDDLLSKMGRPSITQMNEVTYRDFETLVRTMPQASKFSSQQLKNIYMSYASGPSPAESTMKTLDFKDKFFPGIHWQRQPANIGGMLMSAKSASSDSENVDNRSVSMHVDNILAGIKQSDLNKPKVLSSSQKSDAIKDKEKKYGVPKGSGMH
jgi:hypothetical protein